MKKRLKPDLFADSIFDIDFHKLKNKGISNLIIDVDNTIVSWDQNCIDDDIKKLLDYIRYLGFDICFISNNTNKRSELFRSDLGFPIICNAAKPMKRCFKKALDILNAQIHNTAVIGDQIFTDVYGGNRMNMFTILVKPMSKQEFITTKIMRRMEKKIIKELENKHGK